MGRGRVILKSNRAGKWLLKFFLVAGVDAKNIKKAVNDFWRATVADNSATVSRTVCLVGNNSATSSVKKPLNILN